jgi:hypothetical protein
MFEEIKTKIDIIHKSIDETNAKIGLSPADLPQLGLPTPSQLSAKLEQYKSKLSNKKKKKQHQKNIFDEVISVVDKILEAGRKVTEKDRFVSQQRLRQHVLDSVDITRHASKQILMDCVKSVFFANGGICGANQALTGQAMDSVKISPKEIDFLNMFKVPPSSDYGKIMYEGIPPQANKAKINKGLYDSFTGGPFQYDTPSNKTLFTSTWNKGTQTFDITGLTQPTPIGLGYSYGTVKVEDFFNDYYSSMELPDLNEIVKKAMLLTLKAANATVDKGGIKVGGSFTGMENPLDFAPSLDEAINNLNRMLDKMFAFCNSSGNTLSNQNATKLFNENEEDDNFYFNFDDVEGIDLEDEDARKRKVLRFADCNNYEVPYNTSHIEDFIYLENKTNTRSWIEGTLNKAASDAYEQSNFSISLPDFQISLNLSFILNIPKSLVMSLITPKMYLPFVIIYKQFTLLGQQVYIDAKDIMLKLKKIFTCTIQQLFWKFIREFWKKVKVDLKNFLIKIIKKILRDKFKRYYLVIQALIKLLRKIIEDGINNCSDLIQVIGDAIDVALSASGGLQIPNVLLLLAHQLPGFSAVKTTMDITEKMQAMGIPTGDVNGEANYHILSHSAAVQGFADNLATTPFISIPVGPNIPVGALMKN